MQPIRRVISFRLPEWMFRKMEALVEKGVFISISELIRVAIRDTIKKYENEIQTPNQTKTNKPKQKFW